MEDATDRYARYTRLKFDRPHPRVLRITLASPLKMGAMDAQMHREASEIWADVDADDSVSVAIVTGDGKTFSAGGDLNHERKVCDDYALRMQAMTESSDGFELAERDLAIRGAGEVFGERQAGWTDLKLGRLPQDEPIVFEARGVAEEILDADADLDQHAQLREEVQDLLGDAVDFLFKS